MGVLTSRLMAECERRKAGLIAECEPKLSYEGMEVLLTYGREH